MCLFTHSNLTVNAMRIIESYDSGNGVEHVELVLL